MATTARRAPTRQLNLHTFAGRAGNGERRGMLPYPVLRFVLERPIYLDLQFARRAHADPHAAQAIPCACRDSRYEFRRALLGYPLSLHVPWRGRVMTVF